jgi:amino acid adenylation domain-containing protein
MEVRVNNQKLSPAKYRLLQRQMSGTAGQDPESVHPRPPGTAVPLSPAQRRIWLHAAQQPELPLYNESITIHRHGSFDLGALEASVNEILRRHEIWRTSFTPDGETVIHDAVHVTLPFVDLSGLSPTEQEAAALRLAGEDAKNPLAVDRAPLFRARVVRMKTNEHRLYLTLHHLIFDGVSISRIFLPELAAIYASSEQGKRSPLQLPKLQYGDYALWRERRANSLAVKQHLAYWFRQLSGPLPVLHIPVDRPGPAIASHRGSAERFRVPADLLKKLGVLCRAQGVTLYMALLAAFKVLLFRYGGQNDLIVGSVGDGRRRPEFETLMGCFLDTFAVRTQPAAELPFSKYLAQTREAVLGAIVAADVPFDRIVQEINPPRDARHHPVFQAFFNIRPQVQPLLKGWNLTTMDVTPSTTKFALNLELCEWSDYLEARFLYSTENWEAKTIRRMAAHWLVLLRSVCLNPETKIGDLAILAPEESACLSGAGGWNDTNRDFPQKPLQCLIEDQVCRTPHAVAASFAGERWTYGQLNLRAEVLAGQLRTAGVTRGSTVAIALDRSLDMLAGLFAVLKTGAAYLPLNIHLPPEQIALQLADAKPAALLTQYSISQRITGITAQSVPAVFVDGENDASLAVHSPANLAKENGATLDDTAYVIYTSGTTGEPKAVEISQRSLVNLLTSMQTAPGFGSNDALLAVTPISFDIAALELFLPLISGGRVAIASREETLDPCLLANAIVRSECTVMQATPSTWRMLLLSGRSNAPTGSSPGMRRLLCGGEALPRELANRLLATGAEVWNMYGPTETTIWSMIHPISARISAEDEQANAVPVGRPIANTTAHILDAHGQTAPIGVHGELFLGGLGLAKGYRGRPQQTAERFVRVKSLEDLLLYRTGDVAVRRDDGTIVVLGRTDNQVKVRGYRVELEAVEAAVLRHPDVAAAAARVWPEPTGDSRLSVYLVAHDGAAVPGAADLRAFLRRNIPDSMIPSDVTALSALPLTPHGKVDRSRLPRPIAKEKPVLPATPGSPEEARLCRIWADVLGSKDVGLDDNFFDLGGHSLLVAQVQQRIASEFGQRIAIAELFHSPTVRQQAKLMQKREPAEMALPPGVLALQSRGTGSSIFWIHYLNRNLVRELKDDHPFFVVSLTAEDTRTSGSAPSIESLAAHHVRKILATQPAGPYVIGGQCVGGVLAYEVARQLSAAGKEVPLLVLLDVPNPSRVKSLNTIATWSRYLRYLARRTAKEGARKSFQYVHELVSNQITRALRTKSAATPMRIAQEIIETAARSYRVGTYHGPVLLILSSEHAPHRNFLPEWKAVVPDDLHVHHVNGHHRELDANYAPTIAAAIVRLVSAAGQRSFSCSEVSGSLPETRIA